MSAVYGMILTIVAIFAVVLAYNIGYGQGYEQGHWIDAGYLYQQLTYMSDELHACKLDNLNYIIDGWDLSDYE